MINSVMNDNSLVGTMDLSLERRCQLNEEVFNKRFSFRANIESSKHTLGFLILDVTEEIRFPRCCLEQQSVSLFSLRSTESSYHSHKAKRSINVPLMP